MDIINYSRYALIIQNNHYEIVAGVGAIYILDDQAIEVKAFAPEEELHSELHENELTSEQDQRRRIMRK